MAETLRPASAEETRQAVAWALGEETPLEIVGAGTKRAFGQCFALYPSHCAGIRNLTESVQHFGRRPDGADQILGVGAGWPG